MSSKSRSTSINSSRTINSNSSRSSSSSRKSNRKLSPLFTKRPSRKYCKTEEYDKNAGEKYNPDIHFSAKYKVDNNGFVYDKNGNKVLNTDLEQTIKARCGKFYTKHQIKLMVEEAKRENIKNMTEKLRTLVKSQKNKTIKDNHGGRRKSKKYYPHNRKV